jgi:hypothetical protein
MPSQPRVRFMVTCRCPSAFRLKLFRNERNSRCVRRGRNSAFQDLKSVLSWDAAVAMAELIAEAAWQFRARELASPPSAYKTISESNIEDINK